MPSSGAAGVAVVGAALLGVLLCLGFLFDAQEQVDDLRAELVIYKQAAADMERGWKECQAREDRKLDEQVWMGQQEEWKEGR